MKKLIFLFASFITTKFSSGQTAEYFALVKRADSLYNAKEYKSSAFTYSEAFKTNSWKGMSNDRYNAACSWGFGK